MNRKKVLVTGAGGFIGGRIVEVLWRTSGWEARAGLRVWSNGARVGRMPVEMVLCDVLDPAQVREAVRGVDAVVHCAVGSGEVTVDGTRNLLEASLEEGVERFVHYSTVDVYGAPTGPVDEDHPLEFTSKEYGNQKIRAEALCRDYAERGLPVVILRPSLVYGPFGEEWVLGFVDRLLAGRRPVPPESARGTCNLLYVDDLVAATLDALVSDAAVGEAFNVNGPDRGVTWNQYFSALGSAIEAPPARASSPSRSRMEAALMLPVRKSAKAALEVFEEPIMTLYKRYRPARLLMKKLEHAVRMTPTPAEFDMYSREVSFETAKAGSLLGYRPRFDMERGVDLTARWLSFHGYLSAR